MKPRLTFDFRDILATPAHALSAKQIFVMTLSLVLGLAVYDIGYYLAHLAAGTDIGTVWRIYGLFPGPALGVGDRLAKAIYLLGIFGGVYMTMLGMVAVASINIERIRGNRFFSARESIRFALRKAKPVFLCETAIVGFVALIIFLFLIVGLFGRIPYLGEWLYSVFLVFPLYFIALFTVFIVLIAQVSVILTPAVAAAERKGETFGLILETFSTIIRQPIRWLGYTAYALVTGKIASFIYGYFAVRSVQAIIWATGHTDGGTMRRLVESALSHLPLRSDLFTQSINIFPGIDWGLNVQAFVRRSDSAESYVMAFMLFLIFASVLGYFLSVIAAAQAYGYVAIRYRKDGYRIDEEPPIGEGALDNSPKPNGNSTTDRNSDSAS